MHLVFYSFRLLRNFSSDPCVPRISHSPFGHTVLQVFCKKLWKEQYTVRARHYFRDAAFALARTQRVLNFSCILPARLPHSNISRYRWMFHGREDAEGGWGGGGVLFSRVAAQVESWQRVGEPRKNVFAYKKRIKCRQIFCTTLYLSATCGSTTIPINI